MSTLWVVGDSTLSEFNDKYYYPRYGYGTMLSQYLNNSIEVKNIALSGRSSKSYTKEPEYGIFLTGVKKGDFLIVGFGHNDEKTEADRYTDANGDYMQTGSFANSLYVNYIKPANEAGCTTILCTPIVRRSPDGVWKASHLHVTKDTSTYRGGDYADAVRRLGADLGIAVVDMTSMTKAFYDELGSDRTIFLHAWPSKDALSVDNTHTNIWGARVNAYMVLKCIKELKIGGLSENVINMQEGIPAMEKYLIVNTEYKPVVFSDKLNDSLLFKDCNGFKGTVFGDVSRENISCEDFVLEGTSDGDIHIAVKNNCGKISAVTDGIAMYYRQLPANLEFELTADLVINNYFENDQVSFGLMVRDDIYIDRQTPDMLGDYVAAAPLLLTHADKAVSSFARRNGQLIFGGTVNSPVNKGSTVRAKLASTPDGYAATFADGPTVTGGFDFKLTAIDSKHVYVGLFVARNADITFKNVQLIIK